MQIDHAQEQCHHSSCTCSVPNGQEFCSDHCRLSAQGVAAGEIPADSCACGHDDCQASPPPAATA